MPLVGFGNKEIKASVGISCMPTGVATYTAIMLTLSLGLFISKKVYLMIEVPK
jgi:NhaP-type Na+/H+ and K+/H+ antiporter